jgi:pimeloyl-ACP methyl ester carboxylesterase
MTERLRQIRVPTMVLVGDRDLLVSRRSVRLLSEGIPTARFVALPGCGHLGFVTQPAAVAQHVNEFVPEAAVVV